MVSQTKAAFEVWWQVQYNIHWYNIMLTGTSLLYYNIVDCATGSVVWLTTERLYTEIVIANTYL